MNKDKLNNIDTIDIMSFLNSMQSMQKGSKIKKKSSGRSGRSTIKEEDSVSINECCEDEESSSKNDVEKKLVNKNIEDVAEEDEEDEEDDEDEEDEDDEEDEEDDEDDEDDEEDDDGEEDEDEDEDEDDEEDEEGGGLTSEDLYTIFSNFFADEYGVSIATSLSNIAFELNKLNKNLKSKK
jgi:hypothetical protein